MNKFMWVAGYGSLINKEEFKSKEFKLVNIKGWKRIFNRINLSPRWKKHAKGNKMGTLNVIKSSNHSFNAIIYKIDKKSLEDLKKREIGYHIEKAKIYDFKNNKNLGSAILFVSNKTKNEKQILKNNILPNTKYLKVCREGAYSWGKTFGKKFDKTSFLANKETSIEEYINSKQS